MRDMLGMQADDYDDDDDDDDDIIDTGFVPTTTIPLFLSRGKNQACPAVYHE